MLGLSATKPTGANLYAYCYNHPVNYSDPNGHCGLPLWTKIAIGIVGIAAISMVIEGLIGYLTNGISGLKEGLLDGAADGFMWGGIGTAVSAAFKTIKLYKTGKVILSACFVTGTIVSTKNGDMPIESIRVGDLVWSENTGTGQKALKRVVQTFVHEVDHIVNIDVNGEKIKTTDCMLIVRIRQLSAPIQLV